MREIKLDLHSLYPELTQVPPYDYYILITERNMGTFLMESYGAAIVARDTGERAQILDITVNIPRIDNLMNLLARNQVCPTHLRDVVDDWL